MDDFSKQKIIYPNMTKFLPFVLDNQKYCINQKCFIITGRHCEYLCAFLNSSLFKYCYRENFPELLGGTRELSKVFFDPIKIKIIDDKANALFKSAVDEVQAMRLKNADTKQLEIEIDTMIFDVYELDEQERRAIGFIKATSKFPICTYPIFIFQKFSKFLL